MTIAADPSDFGRLATSPTDVSVDQTTRRLPGLAVAAAASIGAGAIHAAAAGIHAEHVGLTRIFIVGAIAWIHDQDLVAMAQEPPGSGHTHQAGPHNDHRGGLAGLIATPSGLLQGRFGLGSGGLLACHGEVPPAQT